VNTFGRSAHLDIFYSELGHLFVVDLLELLDESIALLFELLDDICETLANGLQLFLFELLKVVHLFVQETSVRFIYLLRLDHELTQIEKVGAHNLIDLRQLAEVVAIVVAVHALRANQLVAFLAKILNHSVAMLLAVHAHRLLIARGHFGKTPVLRGLLFHPEGAKQHLRRQSLLLRGPTGLVQQRLLIC